MNSQLVKISIMCGGKGYEVWAEPLAVRMELKRDPPVTIHSDGRITGTGLPSVHLVPQPLELKLTAVLTDAPKKPDLSVPVSEEGKKLVVQYFLNGHSVNHIVFLFDYKYRIDVISEVIREALREALE